MSRKVDPQVRLAWADYPPTVQGVSRLSGAVMAETKENSSSAGPSQGNLPAASANGKHHVWTHRMVVISLGITVLLSAASIMGLGLLGRDVPPALPALGGTALGALTGMLASIMKQPG